MSMRATSRSPGGGLGGKVRSPTTVVTRATLVSLVLFPLRTTADRPFDSICAGVQPEKSHQSVHQRQRESICEYSGCEDYSARKRDRSCHSQSGHTNLESLRRKLGSGAKVEHKSDLCGQN